MSLRSGPCGDMDVATRACTWMYAFWRAPTATISLSLSWFSDFRSETASERRTESSTRHGGVPVGINPEERMSFLSEQGCSLRERVSGIGLQRRALRLWLWNQRTSFQVSGSRYGNSVQEGKSREKVSALTPGDEPSEFEQKRHRPVIHQANLHVGTKHPRCHR